MRVTGVILARGAIASLAIAGTLGFSGQAHATPPIIFSNGFEPMPDGCPDVTGPNYLTVFFPGTLCSVSTPTNHQFTVAAGSVDIVQTGYGNGFPAAHGGSTQSLDLNGDGPGTISTTLATTAGNTYTVAFFLNVNPATSNAKTLTVAAGSNPSDSHTFSQAASNTSYTSQSFTFIASGASTVLTFTSTTSGASGPVLDDISVTDNGGSPPPPPPGTPEAPSGVLFGVGMLAVLAIGTRLRGRRRAQ